VVGSTHVGEEILYTGAATFLVWHTPEPEGVMMTESRYDIGMQVRKKAVLHVAVYAGVPAANAAFALAKQEFDQSAFASEEANAPALPQEDA
jgi:hypothetical protein